MPVICSNLRKTYPSPDGRRVTILDIPSLEFPDESQCAVVGQSGSGKTTLLNILAGILAPDEGSVEINGTDITALAEEDRDRFRARNIGYIFQTFNLLLEFTALENVMLGMYFVGGSKGQMRAESERLLESVDLADRMHYLPRQLSTGQQQRVSIARALANEHKVILADEPTGNLDAATSERILDLIHEVIEREKRMLILVTHDPEVMKRFPIVKNVESLKTAGEAPGP